MSNIPDAHNAWAPEFFYYAPNGTYYLIWSSVVEAAATELARDWENVGQDHRIWHCTTTDFRSFSPAKVFFDPGYSIIDATVFLDGATFLMAFKDERGTNDLSTDHKSIRLTTFSAPATPFADTSKPVTPCPVEGPTLFRRDDKLIMIYDHYLEGRYGAVERVENDRWEPAAVTVPPGMRHASVLTVPSGMELDFT
jgi:beta-xylosidase